MRILEELRTATTDSHQRLHSAPALCRLIDPDLTLKYYQNALKKFYGFYHILEARYALSSAINVIQGFPPNIVAQNLEHDLLRQNIEIKRVDINNISSTPFSLEETLAYLYVREGSNLGGKVISKNLKERLNLIPGIDNKFFWGHGLNTGENWKLFLSTLEGFQNKVDPHSVAKSAQDLFNHLEAWLLVDREKENA